jgi:transcriptional regulator with XRE-family HTH domain
MKLAVSKAWCLAAARHEGDVEVGAGSIAFDPEPTMRSEALGQEAGSDTTQIAFGRAIQLLRRQHRLTVEKLAEDAQVDISELVAIENDPHYRAEPRAVSKLAYRFKVNAKGFQQLAGNAVARDNRVRDEAMRFAARSGPIDQLTKEESQALEQLITVLGEATDKGAPGK